MSGITSKRCRSCSPNWNATQRETEWACNQLPSDGLTFRQKLPLGSGFDSIGPCADGHFGAIIKAFRDLRLSGATDWLRRFWPGVKRALAYAWSKDNPDRCDPDQTGILAGRRHQTMNMELFGPNSRLGSMYVAALLAAAKMADALREPDFAAKCLKMGKAGRRISTASCSTENTSTKPLISLINQS